MIYSSSELEILGKIMNIILRMNSRIFCIQKNGWIPPILKFLPAIAIFKLKIKNQKILGFHPKLNIKFSSEQQFLSKYGAPNLPPYSKLSSKIFIKRY